MDADARWQLRIDDVVDLLDDAAADRVDPILVEANDDRRDGAAFRDEIAAQDVVVERAAADFVRRLRRRILDQRTDVEAAVLARERFNDRRGREAVDSLHGVDAFDVAGNGLDELQCVAREEPLGCVGLQCHDQGARAGELLAEAFVVLEDRVLFREPRGDVVIDLHHVGAGRQHQRAEDDEDRQRDPPPPDDVGEAVGEADPHRMPLSSSRRVKSASLRPTL